MQQNINTVEVVMRSLKPNYNGWIELASALAIGVVFIAFLI